MLFGFSQTFGPRRLSVRQFCDYLGQREIFGIVDVDPLDAVYDGDVGVPADALMQVALVSTKTGSISCVRGIASSA